MYTSIPYIVEGEVIDVQSTDTGQRANQVGYTCRVQLDNDSEIILPNVVAGSMFGGIGDYLQRRARATNDTGTEYQMYPDDSKNDAQIGDRCYIAFVNGNIGKPVIVAWAPHPNQTQEFKDDPAGIDPQAILQYLGIRIEMDDKGQFRLIHKGAPKVNFSPQGGAGAAAAGALSAAASLAGGNTIGGNDNPALDPADDTETTLIEFLEKGIFRVRDAAGQLIEMDREKGHIYIANNDVPSTESGGTLGPLISTNNTDSEYVLLDRKKKLVLINARKTAQIYSFGNRKDVTEGNHRHHILGDENIIVEGDKTDFIRGEWDVTSNANAEWDINGTKISLGNGKMSFDGAAGELMKQISDTLEKISSTLQELAIHTHTGNLGYPTSPPIDAAEFEALDVEVTEIKTIIDSMTF